MPDSITFSLPSDESKEDGNNLVGGSVPKPQDAIDLGLSVKWAPWNLGASQPSDYGEYFAWGEVQPKVDDNGEYISYDWGSYYWMAEGKSDWTNIIKYQVDDSQYTGDWYDSDEMFVGDGKKTLDKSDDAAAANWGGKWRMPTQAELAELSNSCEWNWTKNYNGSGHAGYKITREGYDGVLFLPAAGFRCYLRLDSEGAYGLYWSSELYPKNSGNARSIYFHSGRLYANERYSRINGFSVRAVYSPTE